MSGRLVIFIRKTLLLKQQNSVSIQQEKENLKMEEISAELKKCKKAQLHSDPAFLGESVSCHLVWRLCAVCFTHTHIYFMQLICVAQHVVTGGANVHYSVTE